MLHEFPTANRADLIARCEAKVAQRRESPEKPSATAHGRLDAFEEEQRRLIDIAIQAYNAVKTGRVGITGATGSLLIHTLEQMHALVSRSLPEIRLSYEKTAVKRDQRRKRAS